MPAYVPGNERADRAATKKGTNLGIEVHTCIGKKQTNVRVKKKPILSTNGKNIGKIVPTLDMQINCQENQIWKSRKL